jgi:hypothetical protein
MRALVGSDHLSVRKAGTTRCVRFGKFHLCPTTARFSQTASPSLSAYRFIAQFCWAIIHLLLTIEIKIIRPKAQLTWASMSKYYLIEPTLSNFACSTNSRAAQYPTERNHIATTTDHTRHAVLARIGSKQFDARRRKNRIRAHELAARFRRFQNDVQPIVPRVCDGIDMQRNLRALGIAKQIRIKRQRPTRRQQQHLVVTRALSTALPAEGGGEIVAE